MNNSEQVPVSQRWTILRPKFIISLVALLALLAISAGVYEISQSRKDVMQLLHQEAETVTDALSVSAENAIQAFGEIEINIERQLFNTALLLKHLVSENNLSQNAFQTLMQENAIARSFYVSKDGDWLNYAYPDAGPDDFRKERIAAFIEILFRHNENRTSGYVEDWEGQQHFAIALKVREETAWVLCANPSTLLNLRKRVGLGRLIQDIGKNEDIAYIVLQDEQGIIAATPNITSMPSLANDSFFEQTFQANELKSRSTRFNNSNVYEAVKPFSVDGQVYGVIRVGLRMDAVNEAMNRMIQRAVIIAFGFVIVGLVLFNFLVSNQNYSLLTDAYTKIKTYTGNILENMADAVVAVDREGRITLFNRAAEKLFKQSSSLATGKLCRDIIGTQRSLLDQTLASGEAVRDQEITYYLGRQKFILSVTTRLLRNGEGEIDSAVAVIKDLTEKKAFEEKLQRQEKLTAMGELASGVAHEIRNPLNAISIIAQRFRSEFRPREKEEEYTDLAGSVVSATTQVSSIIDRFLRFARPPELNLQLFALNEVVLKVAKLVESQAMEKNIQLDVNIDDNIYLQIDGGQIEEVLLNLVQNSIDATPASGTIRLFMYNENGEAVIDVSDTGCGIAPENLNRIFDLYYTTKSHGTGMGLGVCHRIVTEHGGRISVDSEINKGTTFSIYLPIST